MCMSGCGKIFVLDFALFPIQKWNEFIYFPGIEKRSKMDKAGYGSPYMSLINGVVKLYNDITRVTK